MLTKQCIKCTLIKPVEQFYECSQGRPGYSSYCKPCFNAGINAARQKRKATVEGYLKLLFYYTKRRSKDKNMERDLSWEYLVELYSTQQGKCAITKENMTTNAEGGIVHTNISLDRVDSNKGYTKDNVQLVCHVVNRMKQELSLEEFKYWCRKVHHE